MRQKTFIVQPINTPLSLQFFTYEGLSLMNLNRLRKFSLQKHILEALHSTVFS
ncbi:MAG: hypothetical protein HC862_12170 [Scytonema sp. RU_4_4]|nr:hypothetical protein [Scytonema sp. RU_4_4]